MDGFDGAAHCVHAYAMYHAVSFVRATRFVLMLRVGIAIGASQTCFTTRSRHGTRTHVIVSQARAAH